MPKDMRKMTCLQTLSMFIVGANKGRGIKELERMDGLGGELAIKCLENVKSGRDAEYANLMKKKGIKALLLAWSKSRHTEEGNEREVIEGLQPDSNLRGLGILEYRGIGFPRWLDCSNLPSLVEIYLQGCARCEFLPLSLSRLPFLKTLEVREMPLVKFLFHSDQDEDICSDDMVNRFPSLEELTLEDMSELEEWCSFRGKGGGGSEGQMFCPPRLKKLKIQRCPKLKMARLSPSLETLYMFVCNEMSLGSVKNLPCLSFLEIRNLEEVTYFPEGSLQNLTALEELQINNLKQLKILPKELGDLCKLTRLTIEDCNELVSLPEEMRNLSSINTLNIIGCNKLESLPEVGSSLTQLFIGNCERMKNISGVLSGCQTVLQYLSIKSCPNLESVEFAHLLSLQDLSFFDFSSLPNIIHQNLSSTLRTLHFSRSNSLISLPEWIGSLTELRSLWISGCTELRRLPEGLRRLTKLEDLRIEDCHPDLQRRCESGIGEDWHKISHIPLINIY